MVQHSQGMHVDNFDLSKITTYQAGAVQAAMHRRLQKLCDETLKPFGLTKMQWLIIGNVLDAGKSGARASDLADQLGTTLPYLTTNINLLESKNILVRQDNNQDSRSKLVSVDPNFIPKCDQIENTLRQKLRQTIYAGISVQDFRTYIKVLYQLAKVDGR